MLSLMPGTREPTDWMFLALGMESIRSRVRICCRAVFWTSTTGDSPDTVTVSWSDPTRRSAFTGTVVSAGTMMPSRLNALNPVSVKVTS
jgi:hypothetical protein